MKTFREIVGECEAIEEVAALPKFKSKGIYTSEGAKVNLERKSKLVLMGLQEDGESLTSLTWQQWKKLNVPDSSSDTVQDKFIKSMLAMVKQFNRKVDYNSFSKKGNPSFDEKVDFLIKNCGAKYSKAGINSI